MRIIDRIRKRVIRQAQGIGSLAVATVVVLGVCGVALASMTGASPDISGLSLPTRAASFQDGGTVTGDIVVAAKGLKEPATLKARIDVMGWKDRSTRVLDAVVTTCEPVGADAGSAAGPSSDSPVQIMVRTLTGLRLLTSVTESAAAKLPRSGKVDVIDTTTEALFMGGECQRISMFLSVLDVHIQNAPVSGRVGFLKYTMGQFLNAMKTESALYNENVLIGFDAAEPAGKA